MAIPVASDLFEMKSVCTEDNQFGINVFHATLITPPTGVYTEQQYVDAISTYMSNQMIAVIRSDAQYSGAYVRWRHSLVWGPTYSSTFGLGSGTNGSGKLPNQVTGIVTWRTAIAGRAGRGRSYVPFPPSSQVDADNTPTVAYRTAIDAWAPFFSNVNAVPIGGGVDAFGISFQVFHRAAGTTSPITGYTARKKYATQRRRGNYGRLNPTFP